MMRKNIPVSGAKFAKMIYGFAQDQIDSMREGGFAKMVHADEVAVPQIDLYKIWHFDNKAKSTSLKMIEFNMRSDTIEDLPFPVGTVLTDEQIETLIKYNAHDVLKTLDFYIKSLTQIRFREELTVKYGRDFMNHNDTKIGKDYFIMRLEEAGIPAYEMKGGKRVIRQTKRPVIKIAECLFNYYDFKRPEFLAVVEWFRNQRISETKGVFSDLPEHKLGEVAKYAEMTIKRDRFKKKPSDYEIAQFKSEYPLGWVEEVELKATESVIIDGVKTKVHKKSYWKCWKEAETLNVLVDGFRFDFGTGGIHGSILDKVVRENKTYKIKDADVASMYPNLGISNKVYPEHLSEEFCVIYEDVYNQRKSFPKGSAENGMLKLALNGVYGDSNNQYSPFYDPKYTMMITINGQLSLCLLAEKLLTIPGLKIIQVNTDGVTVALRRDTEDEYNRICEEWQKQVKLQLEFVDYSAMHIRDVNNYLAVYTNGKVKRKGAYQYEDLGWHQNQGGLVIPMAAEAFMLHGTPLHEFIRKHQWKCKWDFMLRTKVPRSSRLIMTMDDGTVVDQQNICRYYPSKNGGTLTKIMPPVAGKEEDRHMSIESGWKVKTCNNMLDFDGDIDYDYYIAEAEKLLIGQPKIEEKQ
jgi:hypothetical protein